MRCPWCAKEIPDDIIRREGARLMVASRADRKEPKDKHAATRAKIRYLMDELEKLKNEYK
jgi:hypothetical protein